jgi:ferritin
MIPEKLKAALDEHISAEIGAAYLYLAMSADFESKAYKGFGRWMRVQFQEEMAHALKFVDYMLLRGSTIDWKDAKAPATSFGTPLEAFEKTLAHEKDVTARIHRLYHLAMAQNDVATQIFLQWFVTEQVEEEARVSEIVEKVRLTADRPGSFLYLDKELGKRTA